MGGGGETLKMKLHLLLQRVLGALLEIVHQILVAWHVNLLSVIVYHTLTTNQINGRRAPPAPSNSYLSWW